MIEFFNKKTICEVIFILIIASNQSYAKDVDNKKSTADFMNAMTVCGAGSHVSIDADLEGSMTSIYEKESTKGRAVQNITTEISKLLPQTDTYKAYLECLKEMLE